MLADYHIHCEFSDDSVELMENQIERAIELGLDEICFCDHVDYGIKKDWDEGNIEYVKPDSFSSGDNSLSPLANVDYPKYFSKLQQMKEIYKDKITIKQGLEFGIQTITINRYKELFNKYKKELDFILLSIHQIDNKELWTWQFQKDKSQKEYNELYYDELYKAIKEYKDYSVLSHLDLIVRYDLKGRYPFEKVKDKIAEILKIVIKDNKGIELNTSSWHYKLDDTMPSRDILKLYKNLGGKIITVGSDGHTTKYLGDHILEARKILKEEIGFNEICTFDKMKPIFHKVN